MYAVRFLYEATSTNPIFPLSVIIIWSESPEKYVICSAFSLKYVMIEDAENIAASKNTIEPIAIFLRLILIMKNPKNSIAKTMANILITVKLVETYTFFIPDMESEAYRINLPIGMSKYFI